MHEYLYMYTYQVEEAAYKVVYCPSYILGEVHDQAGQTSAKVSATSVYNISGASNLMKCVDKG